MNKHEHGEDDEMQASQGFWQTFIVTCEPAKVIGPAEAAFQNPSSGLHYEAFLGFGQSNYLQLYAFIARRLCRLITGVALVCKGNLHSSAVCVKYGATKLHSSSDTSVGNGLRFVISL